MPPALRKLEAFFWVAGRLERRHGVAESGYRPQREEKRAHESLYNVTRLLDGIECLIA